MASSITSAGLSSGLDVESIVSKLMDIERKPLTALNNKITTNQSKSTAYGTLKGDIASLQAYAGFLAVDTAYTTKTATPGDTSVITAAASNSAAPGSYSIVVTQLAKYHSLRTNGTYATTGDTFNTGTVSISVGGGTATDVTIDGSNNSLANIAKAINAQVAGVLATVINDGTTNRLLLTSKTSGSSGSISVSVTDSGSGGDHALTDLSSPSLTELQAADNAQFSVNGLAVTRSSNTVTDVIDGVTLTLLKGTVASPATSSLTVAQDNTYAVNTIGSFVNAYNTVVKYIKDNSGYDAATKTGGILSAEGTARSVRATLSELLFSKVSGITGGIDTLSSVGITLQSDGTLAVDNYKLKAALNDSTKDVKSLFTQTTSGNEGIFVKFNTGLGAMLTTGGMLTARTEGLYSMISSLNTQVANLQDKLTKIEQRYRSKFAALDGITASMSKTSDYLTQQIAQMNANKA